MTKTLKWALGAATMLCAAAALNRTRRSNVQLRNRVVVVTGGGRGLGLAITRALIAEGARVVICGRDAGTIEKAVASLRSQGADAWGAPCDVADPAQVHHFVQNVIDRYQTVDVLVNNAGQCYVGPVTELSLEDTQDALRNIFWAQYHPTMAFLPHMRQNGHGHIVNVTSIGGKVPVPHQAAYVAAKYAATGWSQTLAVELRNEGIEVSTLTPPPLQNGAALHAHFNGDRDGEFTWFAHMLNSPLTSTSPERVARAIVRLLRGRGGERAVGATAWALSRVYGLMPNLSSRVLSLIVPRLPPAPTSALHSDMQLGAAVAQRSRDTHVERCAERARRLQQRYLPEHELPATSGNAPLPT